MKIKRGPRPWPINFFAVVLLTIAGLQLSAALLDLPGQQEFLRALGLGIAWDRDWTIVASSAWFTIELIPIILVWLVASRFARGFITAMAVIKAVVILGDLLSFYALPGLLLGQGVALVTVTLLYTRDANEWFAREGIDPATFR
ncbi:MAG: hypothetical protein ACX930_13690 [Erythrobacter sp.]